MSKSSMPSCPERNSWRSMWARCVNENDKSYSRYGGRGITVCERWRDFICFALDMGHRPPKTTLERIDNNGNYEPGNCKWATYTEQARNRRYLIRHEYKGEMLLASEICERTGINRTTFYRRVAELENAEAAVEAAKEKKPPKTVYGQTYDYKGDQLRVSEICKIEGISRNTFLRRLSKASNVEEAVSASKSRKPYGPGRAVGDAVDASLEAKGDQQLVMVAMQGSTLHYKEWAKRFGISSKVAWQRVMRDGWEWEKALITPITTPDERD